MDILGYGKTLKQRERQRQKECKNTVRKPKKVNPESLSDRITRLQDKALGVVEEILENSEAKSADRLKAASLIFDISGLRREEVQTMRSLINMGAINPSQADLILLELQDFHRRTVDILAGHDKEST